MGKKICLVTYMREGEQFTKELNEIALELNKLMAGDFKVVICCESLSRYLSNEYAIEVYKCSGSKYSRLLYLINNDDSEYFLSIDNDITGHITNLKKFVVNALCSDIGWGRINAVNCRGFIPHMVAVDKLLSHNIIRPLLWKTGYGASIPGQIFMIKKDSYKSKLIDIDTFLDDLAIGLYTNVSKKKVFVTADVLGYEKPNLNFSGLFNQRKRWAKGFYSLLVGTFKDSNLRDKVLIHGCSYHLLWILNWIIVYYLYNMSFFISSAYLLIMSYFVVGTHLNLLCYAIIYQIIFPVFHLVWVFSLGRNLLCKRD